MALKASCIVFALIYSGSCSPIGQTTHCESQTVSPFLAPSTATVCESTPNLPLYTLGLNTYMNNLPLRLPVGPLVPNLGSTTVCESQSNLGLPHVDSIISHHGPHLPKVPSVGQTTVCENVPNVGLSLLDTLALGYQLLPRPVPNIGTTTVCETAGLGPYGLSLGPYSLPHSGLVY